MQPPAQPLPRQTLLGPPSARRGTGDYRPLTQPESGCRLPNRLATRATPGAAFDQRAVKGFSLKESLGVIEGPIPSGAERASRKGTRLQVMAGTIGWS